PAGTAAVRAAARQLRATPAEAPDALTETGSRAAAGRDDPRPPDGGAEGTRRPVRYGAAPDRVPAGLSHRRRGRSEEGFRARKAELDRTEGTVRPPRAGGGPHAGTGVRR
ncbi:hypothetical protein AB0D87_46125, partial [Streptomyces sp. NPDC048342]|uniref:hypothetical protein n=1 Tax=Streptomyces sp. NPDC048342 TaxID=3154716 RepID=UPI00343AD164